MVNNEIQESLVYDVPTTGKLLNLSRATAYSLVNQGVIPSLRCGKKIIIPRKALEEFLASAGSKSKIGNDKRGYPS